MARENSGFSSYGGGSGGRSGSGVGSESYGIGIRGSREGRIGSGVASRERSRGGNESWGRNTAGIEDYGRSRTSNNSWGNSRAGNEDFGSRNRTANDDYGTSRTGNEGFGSRNRTANDDFGTTRTGNEGFGSRNRTANDDFETTRTGNEGFGSRNRTATDDYVSTRTGNDSWGSSRAGNDNFGSSTRPTNDSWGGSGTERRGSRDTNVRMGSSGGRISSSRPRVGSARSNQTGSNGRRASSGRYPPSKDSSRVGSMRGSGATCGFGSVESSQSLIDTITTPTPGTHPNYPSYPEEYMADVSSMTVSGKHKKTLFRHHKSNDVSSISSSDSNHPKRKKTKAEHRDSNSWGSDSNDYIGDDSNESTSSSISILDQPDNSASIIGASGGTVGFSRKTLDSRQEKIKRKVQNEPSEASNFSPQPDFRKHFGAKVPPKASLESEFDDISISDDIKEVFGAEKLYMLSDDPDGMEKDLSAEVSRTIEEVFGTPIDQMGEPQSRPTSLSNPMEEKTSSKESKDLSIDQNIEYVCWDSSKNYYDMSAGQEESQDLAAIDPKSMDPSWEYRVVQAKLEPDTVDDDYRSVDTEHRKVDMDITPHKRDYCGTMSETESECTRSSRRRKHKRSGKHKHRSKSDRRRSETEKTEKEDGVVSNKDIKEIKEDESGTISTETSQKNSSEGASSGTASSRRKTKPKRRRHTKSEAKYSADHVTTSCCWCFPWSTAKTAPESTSEASSAAGASTVETVTRCGTLEQTEPAEADDVEYYKRNGDIF